MMFSSLSDPCASCLSWSAASAPRTPRITLRASLMWSGPVRAMRAESGDPSMGAYATQARPSATPASSSEGRFSCRTREASRTRSR